MNGGIFLGIDTGNSVLLESQRGLGADPGLGFNSKNGISLFLNPYTKVYTLFPSEEINQRLTESGMRFGLVIIRLRLIF